MNSQWVTLFSPLISAVSTLVAVLVYLRNSERNLRKQKLRILGDQSALLFDLVKTLALLTEGEAAIDPYLYGEFKQRSNEVHTALEECIRSGLLYSLLGKERSPLTYFQAFKAGLLDAAKETIDGESTPQGWNKQHLVFGLIRILNKCADSGAIPKAGLNEIRKKITPFINQATTYLDESRETNNMDRTNMST